MKFEEFLTVRPKESADFLFC